MIEGGDGPVDGAQITGTTGGVRQPAPVDEVEQGELGPVAAGASSTDAAIGRRHPWARRALSVGVVLLIAAAIWYLQSGRSSSTAPDTSTSEDAGTGFVSFQSQGIKLGATGGQALRIGQPAP